MKFYTNWLLLTACLLAGNNLSAQVTGGQHVFQFMALSPSARITGLGGAQIAVKDDDLSFAAANPGVLNASMSGRLSFQHNFFLSDIQHGYAAYGQHIAKLGITAQGGIQYVNYGDIKRADEYGTITGKVRASETAYFLGAARPLSDRLSIGLNIRLGTSVLDTYHASALAADAGVVYADTSRKYTIALVLRNAGAQMGTYNGIREDLPTDLQIGFTKQLSHLPFRFGVIMHHLNQWNIRYDDPSLSTGDVLLFGDASADTKKGHPEIDNFFRHFIFNGEFLFGRNEGFKLRFAYNHLRKKELSVNNYRSLAGFSGGVGVKINRFRIDMGYASYHLAGGVVHLGVGTNLHDFRKG